MKCTAIRGVGSLDSVHVGHSGEYATVSLYAYGYTHTLEILEKIRSTMLLRTSVTMCHYTMIHPPITGSYVFTLGRRSKKTCRNISKRASLYGLHPIEGMLHETLPNSGIHIAHAMNVACT